MKTIYDLTEAERATMLKLIQMGLVVRIGVYAKLKDELAAAVQMLQGVAKSCRKQGFPGAAEAVEGMLADVLGIKVSS